MTRDAEIEALLFARGEPATVAELSRDLGAPPGEIEEALATLAARLAESGIALVRAGETVALRTSPEASAVLERTREEEFSRDIGRAGAETLSILLYRGASTRAAIDHIRGVNSTFILRNLLIRGLVERIPNPADQRSFLYRPTVELLAHLGIRSPEELPDYEAARAEFAAFEEAFASVPDHAA